LTCSIQFSSQRRPKKLEQVIFNKYFYRKQTLRQLADEYHRSIPWIRKQIFEYEPALNSYSPREVLVVADATFFGKRRDKFGVLVFKDVWSGDILIWKYIESETIKDYMYLTNELKDKGFSVRGIVIDGKRGLFKAFDAFPVQMCHFHQKMIVQRYITRHPKLEASKDLKKIVSRLTSTTEIRFINSLDNWYVQHEAFLNEKSINPTTGKEYFTHRKLVAAYRSLRRNLPYLFTYKNYPELKIPNTTNSLDGGVFSQLKKLTKIHQGITKSLKSKLIDDYLVSYNEKL